MMLKKRSEAGTSWCPSYKTIIILSIPEMKDCNVSIRSFNAELEFCHVYFFKVDSVQLGLSESSTHLGIISILPKIYKIP